MIRLGLSPFLSIWISFTLIVSAVILVVIIWAIRNKQFSNQKKANHLPLESYIPEEKNKIKLRK